MRQTSRPALAHDQEFDSSQGAHASEPFAALQNLVGNSAIHDALRAGGSPLQAYPHAGALRQGLGRDLPGVAVVDPNGCARRGVEAFTEGSTTHFRTPTPSLKVAAHEATHLLHHQGIANDAGLGAEGHAEAVAHRIVAGERADHLLGGRGAPVRGDEHAYLEIPENEQGQGLNLGWQGHGFGGLKVSDDGQLAVPAADGEGNQRAWATPEHIQSANATLASMGSGIQLEVGPMALTGKAPLGDSTGPERSLAEVVVAEADGAQPMEIVADCGQAAYEIMGAHDDNYLGAAVVPDGTGGTTTTAPRPYQNRFDNVPGTANTTELWFREILQMAYGSDLSVDQLIALYRSQTPDDRTAFEARYGLNAQAVPEVGEAVVIGSLNDSPDWKKDDALDQSWPWHFAACVLKSGADYVTLENVVGTTPSSWLFRMYGPAGFGQSFYDVESPTGSFGNENVAMVARPEGHMRLTVTVAESADYVGDSELYLHASTKAGSEQTSATAVAPGTSQTFVVPLARLIANGESQPITVNVFDEDLWSDDSLVGITWTPPFQSSSYSENGVTVAGEMIP